MNPNRLQVTLPTKLFDKLRKVSSHRYQSMSEYVRELIRKDLEE